ncbi:unnamed protein product [Cuscuta campestris]|uniref:Uncharacterized protein n=1 Tax=Cuscuta campestris TaxID=132261 RepID=A0A484MXW5_9ASTE|nr:unnamed protein product [Cuscuta campestris]
MRDASGMIGRTEARAASFPPRPSLCVGDIKRVHQRELGRSILWRSITAHSNDLCREIGAFGGTGELHLLLDRCVGQRARGTCCPPFLLCFENRVNGEWAEEKEVLSSSRYEVTREFVSLCSTHLKRILPHSESHTYLSSAGEERKCLHERAT